MNENRRTAGQHHGHAIHALYMKKSRRDVNKLQFTKEQIAVVPVLQLASLRRFSRDL